MPNLAKLPALVTRDTFRVVVESPRGSAVKLKYEPALQVMSVSRPLPVGLVFPYDFGFVPSTEGPDEDPVDALLVWDTTSYPGVVVTCRAVGIVRVRQNRHNFQRGARIRNDRILAVPTNAQRQPEGPFTGAERRRLQEEVGNFLIAITILEGKDATILGWGGRREALRLIRTSGGRTNRQRAPL